jgi:hypothetical protein
MRATTLSPRNELVLRGRNKPTPRSAYQAIEAPPAPFGGAGRTRAKVKSYGAVLVPISDAGSLSWRRMCGISRATGEVVTLDHLLFRSPYGVRGDERQEHNGKDHDVQFHAISPLSRAANARVIDDVVPNRRARCAAGYRTVAQLQQL